MGLGKIKFLFDTGWGGGGRGWVAGSVFMHLIQYRFGSEWRSSWWCRVWRLLGGVVTTVQKRVNSDLDRPVWGRTGEEDTGSMNDLGAGIARQDV